MTNISRRRFLSTAACSVAAARLSAQTKAERFRSHSPFPLRRKALSMPADFVGLSYEVQQLTDPSFFSPENTGLVRAFKAIAPQGVLRLGGNTSEFGWWKPTPELARAGTPSASVKSSASRRRSFMPVSAEAVRNLAGVFEGHGLELHLRHRHGDQHPRARGR